MSHCWRAWFCACLLTLLAGAAAADSLRIATFNTELQRRGPGLLLRDILRGGDEQIDAVLGVLAETDADILVLQGIDHDLTQQTLTAFADALAKRTAPYPHRFVGTTNAGLATDLDLDGDGRRAGPGDAQGYGDFYGRGTMAILSRFPVMPESVQDFTTMLWRDLPGHIMPRHEDGTPFPSEAAQAIQRLSSHGHWVVPVAHPTLGPVHILTFHAAPPVFDGPEDRNGRRNHDEVMFWAQYLAGTFGPVPDGRFVLIGDANLDPDRGDGRGEAMRKLVALPALHDPLPDRPTVNWEQTGPMRVDYILPSADWKVTQARVMEPVPEASRHAIVVVDLAP